MFDVFSRNITNNHVDMSNKTEERGNVNFTRISLEGKAALVTGAGRGIGRASALAFAEAGADVAVCDKMTDLEEVAEEIRARGRKGLAVTSHIGKIDQSKNLVEKVMAEFGRIDILFNNAGTCPSYGPLLEQEEWAWDATLDVNVKGAFFLTQMVAAIMKDNGGGVIINSASLSVFKTSDLPFYSVSKAGMVMLTQTMAKEWGQYGIRVNAIAPGLTKTRISESLWKDPVQAEIARKKMALLRLGEPDDIAGVALFLASDLSRFVTGHTIIADGGELLGAPAFPKEDI